MITVNLPIPHKGQTGIWQHRKKNNAVRCGRRFGKTKQIVMIAGKYVIQGKKVGIFTPESTQFNEIWHELRTTFHDCVLPGSAKNDKTMRLKIGNSETQIDFWVTNDNPLAGRGREYHVVLLDEAAFTKNGQMWDVWEQAIEPTLATTDGECWVFSTPFGTDPENFFWKIHYDNPDVDSWQFHYAPTSENPYVSADFLEKKKRTVHPKVWQQEYLAEFVSWDTNAFFKLEYLLDENSKPVAIPTHCDAVFAVMDCAVKSGTNNDATAVMYFSYSQHTGFKLVVLNYEMYSIDAAMLEHCIPAIEEKLESYAKDCKSRFGNIGIMVEDAAGGSFLIQQSRVKGWNMRAIEADLMMKGKDERALIAGGPVFAGDVKLSELAYNKTMDWKGKSANHMINQITHFFIGDKDAAKRADDLLDCFTYGVALSCGDRHLM